MTHPKLLFLNAWNLDPTTMITSLVSVGNLLREIQENQRNQILRDVDKISVPKVADFYT